MSKQWSDSARKSTINDLESGEFGFAPHGVAFKHIDGRYGVVAVMDVVNDHYNIKDRSTGEISSYDSAEALVEDGWVLD